MITTVKSWFLNIPDELKYKCHQELASTLFSPKLNLKDSEQAAEDVEKMRNKHKTAKLEDEGL